jgi:ribosomal protein S14
MKALKIKNKKLRVKFQKVELIKRVKKFLFINFLNRFNKKNNPLLNNKALSFFLAFNLFYLNNISKVKLKSMCVITGRTRSVNNKLLISRVELRRLLHLGLIPGYEKAVW